MFDLMVRISTRTAFEDQKRNYPAGSIYSSLQGHTSLLQTRKARGLKIAHWCRGLGGFRVLSRSVSRRCYKHAQWLRPLAWNTSSKEGR